MNILYGVSGEGFGHSSRAREVIDYLLKKGHKVLVVTYGQAYPRLQEYNPIKVEGIHLCYGKKGLALEKIIIENFKKVVKNVMNWSEINQQVKSFSPDIGITDMEPVTSLLCYRNQIPLISLGNQDLIAHTKIDIPRKYKKNYLLIKLAIIGCVPKADAHIILSFTKEKLDKKNMFVVNPILRKDLLELEPTKENHILVYQMRPDIKKIKLLKKIPEKFIVYGHDKEKVEGNIIFKRTHEDFIKNLASAKAVIGTAGFTLISEAILLKKPYFAIPLKGQFEQTLNALFLREEGLGDFADSPKIKDITTFLNRLEKYESNLQSRKIESGEVFNVLDEIIENLTQKQLLKI